MSSKKIKNFNLYLYIYIHIYIIIITKDIKNFLDHSIQIFESSFLSSFAIDENGLLCMAQDRNRPYFVFEI